MNKSEQLIACLEGEIAKRDARIVELESKTSTAMGVGCGSGNLFVYGDYDSIKAAQKIVIERDQLRAELSVIKAQEPFLYANVEKITDVCTPDIKADFPALHANYALRLYAAPVSEAKAQGIYSADPLACTGCKQGCFRCLSTADHVEGVRAMVAEPVQQVSVPDEIGEVSVAINNGSKQFVFDEYSAAYALPVGTHYLYAAPAAPAADAWIQVSERLPDSGSTVIAYYLNSYGKGRTIRAQHVEAWTIEAEDVADVDTDCVEYSEQDDCYYLLQGWYECIDNWDEYYRVAVTEGPITHWMPQPAAPIKIEANRHDQ